MPVKLLTSGGGGVNLVPSSSIASDQTIYLPTSGTSGGTVLCTDSTGGTANGVLYLNGSKVATSGSALTFDGAILGVNGVSVGRGAGAVSTATAIGYQALNSGSNTGAENTAVGYQALMSDTTGAQNTAVGIASLTANTTGGFSVAVGDSALLANTTGSNHTGLGWGALYSNTTASNNTAVGYQAGYSNTTGADNLFLGYQAGYSNSTGTLNTYLGRWAGKGGTGNNNTIVGINAGYQSTGSQNTFVGARSSGASCAEAMTTGSANTILGAFTGNQGGLDIRTANNYIVLSDGDGNPRAYSNGSGDWTFTNSVRNAQGVSGMIANGATSDVFTLPSVGMYLVFARQYTSGNGGLRSMALVTQGSSTNTVTSLVANGMTFTTGTSGFVVAITNNAGGSAVFSWSYIKILSE